LKPFLVIAQWRIGEVSLDFDKEFKRFWESKALISGLEESTFGRSCSIVLCIADPKKELAPAGTL
jgi:hypothetical protein